MLRKNATPRSEMVQIFAVCGEYLAFYLFRVGHGFGILNPEFRGEKAVPRVIFFRFWSIPDKLRGQIGSDDFAKKSYHYAVFSYSIKIFHSL